MNIKDVIASLYGSFEQKSKNPFFFTLLVVVFYRNWELIYTIFNFSSDVNRIKRIDIIYQYLPESINALFIQVLINVGLTLIVMVFGYLCITVSRYITNVFENSVLPWIHMKTKGVVVEQQRYELLKIDLDNLQTRFSSIRERFNEVSKSRDGLQSELDDVRGKYGDLSTELDDLHRLNETADNEIINWKNKFQEANRSLEKIEKKFGVGEKSPVIDSWAMFKVLGPGSKANIKEHLDRIINQPNIVSIQLNDHNDYVVNMLLSSQIVDLGKFRFNIETTIGEDKVRDFQIKPVGDFFVNR